MAKEQKPTEQLGEIAEQAMEQARRAADIYFDYVKHAISATPSGETNLLKVSRSVPKRISPRPRNS